MFNYDNFLFPFVNQSDGKLETKNVHQLDNSLNHIFLMFCFCFDLKKCYDNANNITAHTGIFELFKNKVFV